MNRVAIGLAVALWTGLAFAGELGFLEEFALAKDREAALAQLIPGTPEYYYFHCLHYQNTGRLADAKKMLAEWIKRHNREGAVQEMENRQALLEYTRDPKGALEFLARRLGLVFNHQREIAGEAPKLPTALDPAEIGREKLAKRAFEAHPNSLDGFENRALFWLAAGGLGPDHRRSLLARLEDPDVPNLARLVVDDLHAPHSKGFGSLPIHDRLLLAQLDECVALEPDLLNQSNFVAAYLKRLRPNPDANWRQDAAVREAYLDVLWAFADRLNAAHNSLKAHVLHHRLLHDRALGVYDKPRFMKYLALPRNAGYMNPDYLAREENRRALADLAKDFSKLTALPRVGDDEALVRSYLLHFFIAEDNPAPYAAFLNDQYLAHTFAEAKIVNGIGDMEKWYAMLPPEKYQALKERIDLDFDFANKTIFAPGEQVTLTLHVKNVKTLLVKVFELNTVNYYLERRAEIDTAINLDGLIANDERTYAYDDAPLRRVARRFEFPALKDRGVYVIDFIGNGKSSRAVIRKGKLGALVRTTPAGHVFTVLDEADRKVMDASLALGTQRYTAGKDGTIAVPFSSQPGRRPVVLIQGDFASLDHFDHEAEAYVLRAGIHVEREALLTRAKACVIVRPCLTLNGMPVALSLLEDPALLIASTDRDGVSAVKEVRPFPLKENAEAVHEFQVPANLAALKFVLSAKVKNLSRNETVALQDERAFVLNGIEAAAKIEDLHLLRETGGYAVEVLGRNGEPRGDRPVAFAIKHRDFRDAVEVTLKTDADGRVALGALPDIDWIRAQGPEETQHTWTLGRDLCTYPAACHANAGETIAVPWVGAAGKVTPADAALLEYRGAVYVKDWFHALGVEDGFLKIKDVPAGDYVLILKDPGARITVRVTAGEPREGYYLSKHRRLQAAKAAPLAVAAVAADGDQIAVKVANANAWTRVHIFGTRYAPEYPLYADMNATAPPAPFAITHLRPETLYVTERDIGDEYRYILERKYARKYPGVMLARPSLLLSPWAVRSTETGVQVARGGGEFARRMAERAAQGGRDGAARWEGAPAEAGGFANFDFLGEGAAAILNLVPDRDGVVKAPRAALGAHQHIHVLAVDPFHTVYREIVLPSVAMKLKDLRLIAGLPPEAHFTEQKTVTIVPRGETWTLGDITTAELETYDTLAKVYRLLATVSGNATLGEFAFITDWPKLDAKIKLEKYAEFACHELNFFLFKKDPAFFEQAVKPALAHKKDKTFLDKWLLGADLGEYLSPWAYGRLNIVERILLGLRIKAEQPNMARHVADLCELLPPDIERANQLFAMALKGRALEAGDAFGLAEAGVELKTAKEAEARDAVEGLGRGASRLRGAAPPAPAGAAPRAEKAGALAFGFAAGEGRPGADKKDAYAAAPAAEPPENAMEAEALLESDADRRKAARQLFRQLDKTMEWAENNYYKLPIEAQNADLITVNAFWRDYAKHEGGAFFSKHIAEASRSFPEMMFALAVLDLPFEAAAHTSAIDGARFSLAPGSPMLIFHKEITAAVPGDEKTPVLVSQNFYRHGERYRHEGGEQLDNYVTDEFLVHTIYGGNLVVTNVTSARRKFDVLWQVPVGAIPVGGGTQTKSLTIDLEPYHTWTDDYFFYFPAAGKFPQYPVHVARDEKLAGFAPPFTFNVVATPSKIDRASWEFLSQHGSEADVLAFMKANNLGRVNLERIAWRVRDAAFFDAATALLRTRHVFHPTLWSYAIRHDRPAAIREFLEHQDAFLAQCGAALSSPLLTIDPVIRKAYQHLEYWPLVNARAHRLGKARQILNDRFFQQYTAFTRVLSYLPTLGDEDRLSLVCYLLMQDRFEEAFAHFAEIAPEKLAARVQYDYCKLYLALASGDIAAGRALAGKYASYGHERWRKLFAAAAAQLDEIEGKPGAVVDDKDRTQAQSALAATEASFDLEIEGRALKIAYQGLARCTINYYLMDIELLFSRNPFVGQHAGQSTFIRPNATEERVLDPEKTAAAFEIPAQFQARNVMIEVAGAGIRKSRAYFSNALAVQVIENYGQVKVAAQKDGTALPAVYVKVYARQRDGTVKFYKDGYTDLRGRFDYASLSTDDLDRVERFALLLLSEEHGAVVREAAPPAR
ncbi:MAG TPA: hypothetical protein PKX48_12155 [Planctomycetota bacterium]|jgi:hypothetical protein|nr:hypothetical protein [Planctomycetota bacterium]OQC20180.1 MAG: hypothetical protein BWX69_02091 [Planctomycetes bacterium ADurb.Bin069]HNR99322.1 hypothetical protein [Planctomycetota bacterium]HNU26063.1 hypothetical protein [Planctomycetota bacterium]HOE30838.1 hypothetical protein [Planctomycetota bacterium]